MPNMGLYAKNVAVIRERWTKRGGRFVLKTPTSHDTFEFDSTSERADQLRNACLLAQRHLDEGKCDFVAFQGEDQPAPGPRVKAVVVHGQIVLQCE